MQMVRLVIDCVWADINAPNDFGGLMWGTESRMLSLRWVWDGRKRDSKRGDKSSSCHNRIKRCVREQGGNEREE